MAVWILDNRDSFVFNLQHRLFEVGVESRVVSSEATTIEDLEAASLDALVISPGPGHPDDAGVSVAAIRALTGRVPILGVCLGHQAIGVAFGGTVSPDQRPCHGRATAMTHDGHPLFAGITSPFDAARYHSLAIDEPVPDDLQVIARGDELIMAIVHERHPTYGVQFHPESILSEDGLTLLRNFARIVGLVE